MELRPATHSDAASLTADVADGFATYREWAPPGWAAPSLDEASTARLLARLARPDVWCVIALDRAEPIAHVALSPVTTEEPEPAPPGAIYLWQLFVRRRWHGTGVARELMAAAVAEAGRRGFVEMLLWTPRGAARARGFYEREGWAPTGRAHEHSPLGLPTVEYRRELAAG